MVVTPGVARARRSPFSLTTMPMIFGRDGVGGERGQELRDDLFAVGICWTCLGETKLTASMCWKPVRINSFK